MQLQECNLALKLEVTLLKRKADIDEEELAAWRTEDYLMRAAEGNSPTPVIDNTENVRYERRNHGREDEHAWKHRRNTEQPEEETHRKWNSDHGGNGRKRRLSEPKWNERDVSKLKKRRELNVAAEPEEDSRMEIAETTRHSDNARKAEKRQYTEQCNILWEHRDYLQKNYKRDIGLPLDTKQDISIYSFTEHRIARGYQKVVTTCQGMYFELTKEQVVWNKVPKRSLTIGGDTCWRGEGVSVYKPNSEGDARPVVRHRFAINLSHIVPKKKLRTDRYYIHVYQTKVGPWRKTLRSKEMVREMQRRFKTTYWPRLVDTLGRRDEKATVGRRKYIRVRDNQRKEERRRPNQETSIPTERRSWSRTQKEQKKLQMQEVMTELQRLSAVVERTVGREANL